MLGPVEVAVRDVRQALARDAGDEDTRREARAKLIAARDEAMVELQAERLEANEGFLALLAYLNAHIEESR